MPASKRPPNQKGAPRSLPKLSGAQLERKRASDREAQRVIRERRVEEKKEFERQVTGLTEGKRELERQVTELTEGKRELERQATELAEGKEQLEAQIAALQCQVKHMALLLQSLVGPEYTGTAPACGTNSYIMPKVLSMRIANRGAGQNTTTEVISHQYMSETNIRHWATQRPGTSLLLSNGGAASGAPSPGASMVHQRTWRDPIFGEMVLEGLWPLSAPENKATELDLDRFRGSM
jgi:hypothetical protein